MKQTASAGQGSWGWLAGALLSRQRMLNIPQALSGWHLSAGHLRQVLDGCVRRAGGRRQRYHGHQRHGRHHGHGDIAADRDGRRRARRQLSAPQRALTRMLLPPCRPRTPRAAVLHSGDADGRCAAQRIPGMRFVNETRVWTLESGCNEAKIDALPPMGFVLGNKIFQLTSRQYIVAVRSPLTMSWRHGFQLHHGG